MAGGAAKRSSEDCVSDDAKKKKKISKDKPNADVLKEKTTAVCNGDSRQKRAFFAYFGKSFDDVTDDSSAKTNRDVGGRSVEKKNGVKETSTKVSTKNAEGNGVDGDQRLQTPVSKSIEKAFVEERDASDFTKINANLPYVSSFVEESACFPKITHANRSAPLISSDLNVLCLNEETLHNSDIKDSILSLQTLNSVPERIVLEPYRMEINLPYMISSLKKSVTNFPISNFHKYMKTKYSAAKKSSTDVEFLWIDKYKPMCKEEMLGNNTLIKDLKNWLDPNTKKSKKGKKYCDDDDFIFDTDSDSSDKAQHNLAILLGPSGCGKTSAVYAVANELNANVIELNASCNRNGKRIITDLMEATQSHAVKNNYLLNMMKVKKKKTKNPKKKTDKNEKMTIILIEDADIFFDNYDDGFLSAVSTLATDSKRPLILTANDPFSNHLLKFFLSNKITLNFIHPSKEHLSYFLQLMALNEGVIMSVDELNTFIHPFKPDIRQSTLQLQYVLSTGEIDGKTSNNAYKKNINSIWWNWPYALSCDVTSVENNKQIKCMETISQNLDAMLKLNLIHSKTQSYDFLDPQPFWHYLATRDSASLIETNHWSNNSVQLSTDIAQWIHNHFNTRDCVMDKPYPSSEELRHRQRTWNTYKNVLDQIGLDYCNRKSETSFDYLATVRSFIRHQHNTNQPFGNLRNSNMFSYLKRINIDVDNNDLKYMCEALHTSSSCDRPVEITDQF